MSKFQFTLPRGERLDFSEPYVARPCFNSRSREGSDFVFVEVSYGVLVSIHAPARGATQRVVALDRAVAVSIHAPARGATV